MIRPVVAALLALLTLAGAGQAQTQPVCPLAALGRPGMEGVERYVVVGQHQPCPPRDRTWQDFDVRTDFGDGFVAGTPYREGDHLWFMGGLHTYRRAGRYVVIATATDRQSGDRVVLRREIEVPNAPLNARGLRRPTFVAGRKLREKIARFRDGNRLAEPADFKVQISWNDGSRSNGTVVKRGRDFEVVGAHRYRKAAAQKITVVIHDDRGARLTIRTRATVRA